MKRLRSRVHVFGGGHARITRRWFRVVGIEVWLPGPEGAYHYTALIDPSARGQR